MNLKKVQIFINISIIILEIIGFILVINELGAKTLQYYTEDSNFLLLISSIIILAYLCLNKEFPSWFKSFRFISVVSTTLTLIIVVSVLSWITDLGMYHLLFEGSMLYHHTLCPVLALISFLLIEKYDNLRVSHGLLFTAVYAIVMILANVFRVVKGPYPFLEVYNQTVFQSVLWTVIIFAITYIIALLLKKINEKSFTNHMYFT